MTRAENHLLLIDGARTMAEKTRQLRAASNDCTACEYEDGSTDADELGMTLECVTAFDFSDGSRLERSGESVWIDGAWSVSGA